MKATTAAVLLVALLGAASAQTAKPVAAAVAKAVPKFPVFATPNAAIDSTINNATNKAPCLSTFKTALGLAGLAEDFDNITTKRTVFAPSDAAFKKLNLSDDTLQTLMLEKGADILKAHIVPGAALSSDRVAALAGKDVNGGANFTAADNSTITVFALPAAGSTPATGNTRKLLQVEVSPSPSPAVGVSPGPLRTAIATALGVSPSPAVAAVEASPAVAAAVEASPAVGVSPAAAMPADAGMVTPSPVVAALPAVEASPAPLPADAGAATALPGVSPAVPLDTGAGAMPGVSPEVGVSPDMAALPVDAAAAPEVPCPEGTPSGITVTSGNSSAEVVYPDLASGGTIFHVIDNVIIPAEIQAQLDAMVKNISASQEEAAAAVNATAASPSPAPTKSSAAGVAASVAAALAPAVLLAML